MNKLEHPMTSDLLFKMFFVQYPNLLKNLISEVLGIDVKDMNDFNIINPEIPPDYVGNKFCILDINMKVNGQRVDLEIQVKNEGDYPERSLYYWARDYSATLPEGEEYLELPRVVIISILNFKLFDGVKYHSEFLPLEKEDHTLLTDKMSLHYFELPKIKGAINKTNTLELWLRFFKAKTEEDINKLEKLEVKIMKEAITAYKKVSTSEQYREIERMKLKTKLNEASALGYAERKGMEKGRKEGIEEGMKAGRKEVAKLEKLLAEKDAEIARLTKKKNK